MKDTAGRPIDGAIVEATSAAGTAVTVTNPEGQYSFSQTFSRVPIMRASKAGYLPAEGNVFVLNGTSVIRGLFGLASPNPPVDLGGRYVLTFTADPACTALPLSARTRSYQTTVGSGRSTPPVLTLVGAQFAPAGPIGSYGAWDVIYVAMFENFVRFHFSDPPIWEMLDAQTSVYINGSAEGTLAGPVSEFPLSGEFEFCGTTADGECEEELECESTNHKLTLTRQ